jgi:formylglycine-generating enzyme required for sulfatase activity
MKKEMLKVALVGAMAATMLAAIGCGDKEDATPGSDYGIEMVQVAGGTFTMGCDDCYDDEKPSHSVTLSSFSIG